MDWTKGEGATHLTPADCDAAPAVVTPAPSLRREPVAETPADRDRMVALLLGHPWQPATSARYKTLPHEYTLKRSWDPADFIWAVEHIRRVGYDQRFIGRIWVYYDAPPGELQYWECGGPAAAVGVINRAVRRV